MLMRGYRDGTCAVDSSGWLRTGDIGIFEGGVLVVEGREGDLIITGGENVWPESVEDILRGHPHVIDVCIAGVPDAEWGQAVTAWIVTDGSAVSLETIRAFVKEQLPVHCAPRNLVEISEIPRTALGKPRRAELISSID